MGLFDRLLRRPSAPPAAEPPRAIPVADAYSDPNKITQGVRGFANELYMSTSALVNAFTGIGTSRDPSFFNGWAIPRPLSRAERVGMGRNGLIAQALGKLPYTATREGWRPVITDDRVEDKEACADEIAAYESRLNTGTAIARALFRGRQHGHALVLLGVEDGRGFEQPVDWDNVKTIRWAAVIDSRDFRAFKMYPASSEHFGEIEQYEITDINGVLEDGLRYGPDTVAYQYDQLDESLRRQSGVLQFHAERVLSFPTADYLSILDSLQDSLGGYFTSMSGIATAARESSTVVYKITDWVRKAWSEDANLAHAHMAFVDKAKSAINAWVIDKDKEDVDIKNRSMGGVADLSNPFMVWVSAALGEPVTEFWGVSPGGFGKGEAEKETAQTNARAFQVTVLSPQLRHLHALILVAEDGCNLPADIQRTIHYEDLSPPDEKTRGELRSQALGDVRQLVKDGIISRKEARPAVASLADDYFRPAIDLEEQEEAALAPVGVFTGGVQLLQALYPEGIPVEAGRNFMLAVASTFFTKENISGVFPERRAPAPATSAVAASGTPIPADEEDADSEPSATDLAWSKNPLPADAREAPKIAAEFGIPTVRVTRAHKAGLIEGWNVLGGKPRYSLAEVKRVVLQGNGKLPATEPAPTGDKVRDAAARNEAWHTVGVMLRAPKHVAQWVPYKADDPSAPHVTLLYVGKVHPQKVVPILDAVRRVLAETPALPIDFDGVDYFDNEQRVAFARVRPTAQLSALHDALREAIAACGVDVAHVVSDFTPHLTLAYLEPSEDYTGPVPLEGWTAHEVEVWYDDLALSIACAEQPVQTQDRARRGDEREWIWITRRDGNVRPEHAALHGKKFGPNERHATEGEPGEMQVSAPLAIRDPFANQHAARQRDPDDFIASTFRRKTISEGVDIVVGKLKADSRGGMVTQTYRFDANKFTPAQARKWLADNEVAQRALEEATEIDDAIDETLWLASCGDLSEEAKRERIDTAFARYHEAVNMGAAELEAWAETKWSRKASLDRTPIERNLRLLRKRKEDWTLADAATAMRTVNFVSRMRGAEQGEPVKIDGREGPSKRDISLKNWAHDPAK